jgi:hypothetical protein
MLSDLKNSCPTFSDLIKLSQSLPSTPRVMAPQPLYFSKTVITVALYGDEEYTPNEDEPKSKSGGRHRVTVVSESRKPKAMTLEINIRDIGSKL